MWWFVVVSILNWKTAGLRIYTEQNRYNCTMRITNHKHLADADLDLTVWRYLTFPKFASLLTYRALWFSKLKILQDKYEGGIPLMAEKAMRDKNEQWKTMFNTPEFHRQIDNWPSQNVEDGRELTVVNCWFLDEKDSQRMWDEYVGTFHGLAIKSTVRKLATYIFVTEDPHISQIGKVQYVDWHSYEISTYLAQQAQERAFIKDQKFAHEKEIRITTMNFKTPCCVNPKGVPYSPDDCKGKHMNNFENPGLYIMVDLRSLIDEIVISPNSREWFVNLIERTVELSELSVPIKKSNCI